MHARMSGDQQVRGIGGEVAMMLRIDRFEVDVARCNRVVERKSLSF